MSESMDDVRSYLRMSSRVIFPDLRKEVINVNEKFTMRFTASNQSSFAVGGQPRVIFLNTRFFIQGSNFASIDSGNGWRSAPDQTLFPGESTFVDVVFTANREIGGWPTNPEELVANAWVLADLDQNIFFQIWNYSDIYQQIQPT